MKAPWRQITKGFYWFEKYCNWEINDGKNLSFWNNEWNDFDTISSTYARLYALTRAQDATIEEMWDTAMYDWNLKFRCPLNDKEINVWNDITSRLKTLFTSGGQNRLIWVQDINKSYTIASTKRQIRKINTISKRWPFF